MKKTVVILTVILMLMPISNISLTQANQINQYTARTTPGDILSFICQTPYPTLSEPAILLITIRGHATEPFNETLVLHDNFQGLVDASGHMAWLTGNITEQQVTITIGKLPTYTKKIMWFPTVVGNHTLSLTAGSSPEQHLTLPVSFDVQGIISPSFGHPSIISQDQTTTTQVTIAEKRVTSAPSTQITQAQIISTEGTTQYPLDNIVSIWRASVPAGTDIVQDELLVTYNTTAIPPGFYDITVQTTKQNYSWQHAMKIQATEPSHYTIVQLTDIHVGKYMDQTNKVKSLTKDITYINENINPDFVIISGDSIDWYNIKSHRNVYLDFKNACLSCNAPIFTVPGNHERYGNSFLFLYTPDTNLTSYHRYLNPLSDYSFHYGNVNYVFLDSGYDYSRWEINKVWNMTPESTGLTNTQMYLLNNIWGESQMNQIITMHHPALYDTNDTGPGTIPNTLPSGNDQSIAFNRGAFIQYCIQNNVSLSLAGHTHENHVFTSFGTPASNASAWPLFIETRSSTLSKQNNGGRIIHIQNSAVIDYDYVPFS
jgi:predicted MPP superfamily phosphohydrolase